MVNIQYTILPLMINRHTEIRMHTYRAKLMSFLYLIAKRVIRIQFHKHSDIFFARYWLSANINQRNPSLFLNLEVNYYHDYR